MSANAVERLFWEFGDDPTRIERFNADPEAYMADYDLEPWERQAIIDMDVRKLTDSGVSTLLAMMVWPMMNGTGDIPFDYLKRMNYGTLPRMGLKTGDYMGLRAFLAVRGAWRCVKGLFGGDAKQPA